MNVPGFAARRPADGHTLDQPGPALAFSSHRGGRAAGVISLAMLLVLVCGVTLAPGNHDSFNDAGSKIAIIAIFVVPSAWFGVRFWRMGVKINSREMTVRNLSRTRVIAVEEIRRIDLAVKSGNHASPDNWVPRIGLANGDSIWIEGLTCGVAKGPPEPKGVAALDELRALIGLQPPSSINDQQVRRPD